MRIRNSETHFGLITILLHWIIAILIIGLLALGLYMVDLPISLEKLKLYGWHKEYGLLALALVILRLGWRLINITPNLSIPFLEKIAARAVHWAFYGFMFAMPITGWLVTSSAGLPASFFGLFTLPDLVGPNHENLVFFTSLHEWLGYGLIATIILHTLAALKHHFINKDDILRRMIS
ncbi:MULTISPECIES: cytochrome b [Legionella]|uniref:Cytochrome b561 transmembrane protein n=1 Tax=Legionella drozanskii LLAP-1 TaxID=1212489 RepID=A0A0W0SW98_9GAMM|nr:MULTISPECIES: cytochrome b [Legionella]KTC87545.1 cytochrome b561 transmembrane protein [Legionella drozanskii LLAP-1]PJE10208.1 MAG: cytochrome b [Legionella sp.]